MKIDDESILEKINNRYYDLTATERKVADYIIDHQRETQFMSIVELAEQSGVGESTITRFSKHLGFRGYNALKLSIANSIARIELGGKLPLKNKRTLGSYQEICQKVYESSLDAITETYKMLKKEQIVKAADMMKTARKVLCMGQGGSMLIASEAAHLLSTYAYKFFDISDSHYQVIAAAAVGKDDLILYFSYSGATKDIIDTLGIAKENKAKVILVTRFPKCPGAKYADLVLQCGSNESPLVLGSAPAKVAQIFLVDIILAELCRRDSDGTLENKNKAAKAMETKYL